MGQDLSKIEAMYDAVAEDWAKAFLNEHEKKPMDREMLDRFCREIGHGAPVWDFGCGPGNTAQYLKDNGIEVSGLDLSEQTLVQARKNHPRIHFQKGNLLDLEFEDNSICGVVAFYAIVHFTKEQVETAFHEIFRVLKPGGRFLFTYHVGEETLHINEYFGKRADIDFMFFSTEFITICLEQAGYTDIEVTERDPYPDAEYQSRRAYAFASKLKNEDTFAGQNEA